MRGGREGCTIKLLFSFLIQTIEMKKCVVKWYEKESCGGQNEKVYVEDNLWEWKVENDITIPSSYLGPLGDVAL
jgi:hypothetical protein